MRVPRKVRKKLELLEKSKGARSKHVRQGREDLSREIEIDLTRYFTRHYRYFNKLVEKSNIENLLIKGGIPKLYVPLGLIALENALRKEKEKMTVNKLWV